MCAALTLPDIPFSPLGYAQPCHCAPRPEAGLLARSLMRNERVFLDGRRFVGKTTLVLNTCADLDRPVLRMDFGSLGSEKDLCDRVWSGLQEFAETNSDAAKALGRDQSTNGSLEVNFGVVRTSIGSENSTRAVEPPENATDALRLVNKVARASGAVVFCDEFQGIRDMREETSRSMLQRFASASDPAVVRHQYPWVFAGSNRYWMHRIFTGQEATFFQQLARMEVSPIPAETLIPFLNARFGGKRMSESMGKRIYDWCDGVPGTIQRVYNELHKHCEGSDARVKAADLEAVQKQMINDSSHSYSLSLRSCSDGCLETLDLIASKNIRTKEQFEAAVHEQGRNFRSYRDGLIQSFRAGYLSSWELSPDIERPDPLLFHFLSLHPAMQLRKSWSTDGWGGISDRAMEGRPETDTTPKAPESDGLPRDLDSTDLAPG